MKMLFMLFLLEVTKIVIAEKHNLFTEDDLISADGTVNHIKAQTMTVAGLDAYYLPQKVSQMAYAKPGTELHLLNNNSESKIKQ